MNIKCPSCNSVIWLNENEYTQEQIIIKCSKCEQKIRVPLKIKKTVVPEVSEKNIIEEKLNKSKSGSSYFSFEGRIKRKEYVVSTLVFLVLVCFMDYAFRQSEDRTIIFIALVLVVPTFLFYAAQSAKRCHDINKSGWCQLIPFYTLVLLFQEGEKRNNKYGVSIEHQDFEFAVEGKAQRKNNSILIALGAILLIALLTNPTPERHKEAVKNKINKFLQASAGDNANSSDWGNEIEVSSMMVGALVERIVDNAVTVDNYVLFSLTNANWLGGENIIGIGLLGNVFISSEMDNEMEKRIREEKSKD